MQSTAMKLRYRVGLPGWRLVAKVGVPMQVRVEVHFDEESNSYWASSLDLDGLVVSGRTLDELKSEVVNACEELLQLQLNGFPRHVVADMHLASALCAA
jgi:hypothetical protein